MKQSHIIVLSVLLVIATAIYSYDNGLARTPPMGFNTWNQFFCNVNETIVRQTIDSMASSGLRDLGYKHVNIDDCWALMQRDPTTKRMVPDPKKFPSGMLSLSRYAQSKGLKLGIYSDVGTNTCQGYPGSYGFYEIDAQTFADWEIDYLKLDYCHSTPDQKENPWNDYTKMSKALNATGRPIVFSICNWGVHEPWKWAPKIANLWRTTGDIEATWQSVMKITDENKNLFPFSGVHNWNDPDMLEVGVKVNTNMLSPVEAKTHFSLWCMLNAPLILGNDLRNLAKIENWVLDIITNRDAISINQDSMGIQAVVAEEIQSGIQGDKCSTDHCVRAEIWMRPISDNRFAVLLFNRGGLDVKDDHFSSESLTLNWAKHLKVDPSTPYLIKDVWANHYYGVSTSSFTTTKIDVHDAVLLILTPTRK